MKKRTLEQQFARKVTQGLWILPWRRREAQREILEHLEDLADERGVSQWTEDMLEREFGSRKRLRKLYRKNGVPIWGKLLKFGVGCAGFVLFLFVCLDLGILWFFPIEPAYIELMRSKDPFAEGMRKGKIDLPKVDVQWMEEGDERSKELLNAVVECKAIIDRHGKTINETRQTFLEKRRQEWVAQGVVGATRARMIAEYQNKFSENMFGFMGGKDSTNLPGMPGLREEDAEEFLLYETANPQFVEPALPKEDFEELVHLWTCVKETDRLRFPREIASEKDAEQLNTFLANKGKSPTGSNPSPQMDPEWLGVVMAFHTLDKEIDGKESIQRAKDLTAASPYCEKYTYLMQILAANIPGDATQSSGGIKIEGAEALSDRQVAEILEASARWARLFLEALRPNPEPLLDYLFMISALDMTYKAVNDRVNSLDDLVVYEGVLCELSRIEITDALEPIERQPQVETIYRIPTIWKLWALKLSRWPPFRAQCSAMQWFCAQNSDRYFRYEVLKNYIGTMLVSLSSPNHQNILIRSKILLSKKVLAQSALALREWRDNPNRTGDFDLKSFKIVDPFQLDGPQFLESESAYEFRCAGPDEIFGNGVYDPSNGIASAGDIVWILKK